MKVQRYGVRHRRRKATECQHMIDTLSYPLPPSDHHHLQNKQIHDPESLDKLLQQQSFHIFSSKESRYGVINDRTSLAMWHHIAEVEKQARKQAVADARRCGASRVATVTPEAEDAWPGLEDLGGHDGGDGDGDGENFDVEGGGGDGGVESLSQGV